MATENASLAGAGGEEAAQHPDGGGLARAVRSQQTEDFALANAQGQIVDRSESAEAFDQMLDLYNHGAAVLLVRGWDAHHVIAPPPG